MEIITKFWWKQNHAFQLRRANTDLEPDEEESLAGGKERLHQDLQAGRHSKGHHAYTVVCHHAGVWVLQQVHPHPAQQHTDEHPQREAGTVKGRVLLYLQLDFSLILFFNNFLPQCLLLL